MMPNKSRKSGSHKKTRTPKKPKKKSSSAKCTESEVDAFSPAARENLYYISHNAAHCLEFRGFGWPKPAKKKKKKGTKRKKK
ncbi:small lysine-rich protein 1 [Odontesthes bonariensis]|uniref:small lysine-rich protein 1 n=1 Tax=Odontesthes bonariensis TaxID=219752 RepID=UPI003F58CEBE